VSIRSNALVSAGQLLLSYPVGTSFTIAGWVKFFPTFASGSSGYGEIFTYWATSGTAIPWIGHNALTNGIVFSNGTTNVTLVADGTKWCYLAMTYKGGANTSAAYGLDSNGLWIALTGTATTAGTSNNGLYIGGTQVGTGADLDILYRGVNVWSVSQSREFIMEQSRQLAPLTTTNLYSTLWQSDNTIANLGISSVGHPWTQPTTGWVSSADEPPVPKIINRRVWSFGYGLPPPQAASASRVAGLGSLLLLGQRRRKTSTNTNYTAAPSESITPPTDAVSRVFVGARAISESITAPSDSVTRAQVLARQISESVTAPSDSVSRAYVGHRTLSESITAPSDSIARAQVLARPIAESITAPSDAAARSQVLARAISESVTAPSDAVSRFAVMARAIAEAITSPSDAVARVFIGARAISESITAPSDAVARSQVLDRAIAESITAPSDSVAVTQGVARAISESITAPSDSVVRVFVGARSISEAITAPSDVIARAQILARAISESVTSPSDSVAVAQGVARSISESITAPSDAVARKVAAARAIAENVTSPSDAVARALVQARTVSESIASPTDSPARTVAAVRAIAETVPGPTDSPARQGLFSRAIPEAIVSPSDAVTANAGASKAISEAIVSPSDAVSSVQMLLRGISEAISPPSDAVVAVVHHVGGPTGSGVWWWWLDDDDKPLPPPRRRTRKTAVERALEQDAADEAQARQVELFARAPVVAPPRPPAPAPRPSPPVYGARIRSTISRLVRSRGTADVIQPVSGVGRSAFPSVRQSARIRFSPHHGHAASTLSGVRTRAYGAYVPMSPMAWLDALEDQLDAASEELEDARATPPAVIYVDALDEPEDELRADVIYQDAIDDDPAWRQDPVHPVAGGYRWGASGKIYKSKAAAQRQAAAIYASGWRENASRQELHAALSPPRAAEAVYTREMISLFRGIHAGVMAMVKRKLFPKRPKTTSPNERHDAQPSWRDVVRAAFAKLGDQVADHMTPRVNVAYDKMSARVNDNGEKAARLLGIQPKAAGLQAIIDRSRAANLDYMVAAGRDYVDDVRDVLEDPDNFEMPIDELSDLLEKRAGVSASRANLIASDQTLKLNAGINRARQEAAGVSQYRWSTSKDERVRPMHADLEGTTQSYDDPPETTPDGDTNNPGEDYRCFPADSELQFAYGIKKAFRRWYDGELAELVTDSGKTVRATPNHPVLTRRGWVAIGDLQLTDDVLEIAEESLAPHEGDKHHHVARIGDVFATLQVCAVSGSARGKAADFHGDGREGHVDVVLAAGPLSFGSLAGIRQGVDDLPLSEADPPGLALRATLQLFDGLHATSGGGVGRPDEGCAFIARHPSPAQEVGLGAGADADPGAFESRRQDDALDASALGDREQALSALVCGDDRGHVHLKDRPDFSLSEVGLHADSPQFLAQIFGRDADERSDLLEGLAGIQKFARVRSVNRLAFHGWVFNLETATGWYAIDGILAHNCRCISIPIIEELEEPDNEEPDDQEPEPEQAEPDDEDIAAE
jgi:SPP1 gp7 family putative phage head morphogenesis protein